MKDNLLLLKRAYTLSEAHHLFKSAVAARGTLLRSAPTITRAARRANRPRASTREVSRANERECA
jgi:hypothetical protein